MKNGNNELKHRIWKNFAEQQHVFLATNDGSQPRVRPVTLIYLQGNFYIATGSNDAKVKQIKRNPRTEFCLLLEKGDRKGTLRAECIAKSVEGIKIKTQVYEKIAFIKEFFKSPEDPGFALIWLQPRGFEYMEPGSVQAIKVKL